MADDLPQLRARITKEWPHMGAIDIQPALMWKKFGADGKGLKGGFEPVVENFYLTNSICRASKTMAKCVEAFVEKKQQPETAEASTAD